MMLHRRHLLRLLACTLLLGLHVARASQPTKLVFHVNDDTPEHQEAVLRNLHNHLASVGPDNTDVRVLLQGGGVTMLLLPAALPKVKGLSHANATPAFRERIDALRAEGVVFEVSGPTLLRHRINFRRDLYGVHARDVVTNSLSHLADLQQRGYTYIKP